MDEEQNGMKSVAELEAEAQAKAEKESTVAKETAEKEPEKEPKKAPEGEDSAKKPENDEKKPEKEEKEPEKGDDSPYGKPGHTPAGLQERFNKLTRKNYEQNEKIRELQAQIDEMNKAAGSGKREPTKEDFIAAGKTEEDFFNFKVQKGVQEALAKIIHERERTEAERKAQDSYHKREEEARGIFQDYDSVVYGDEDVTCYEKAAKTIRDCENGPEVVYTLHKNPKMREQMAMLNEEGQVKFVKGLSEQLVKLKKEAMAKASAPKENSTPPEPPKTVVPSPEAPAETKPVLREPSVGNGGKPVKPPDISKCSMEEFESYYGR